ncbi:MAG TPA: M20/M25/M40 family metallo-hydrolase [Verrucomicrobiae bacterium]|nr:M20/M25/M40 family metallo-hydrolase [Verrucomicrobiae bacterium]
MDPASIFARTRTPAFARYLADLLAEICQIDTTPNPDVSVMRRAESAAFDILERELRPLPFQGLHLERRPINPAIAAHPNFSLLHFTKTPDRPQGLPVEQAYRDRANLLCILPGQSDRPGGHSVALNSHVDVVAPFFPPREENGVMHGRGSCDDKGAVVATVAALKVLAELMPASGLRWNRNVVLMFVIEEEPGGNGSLSLAMDRDLKKFYDTILVGECTDREIHPANRGAVWYRADLRFPGVSLFEMFAFVNEELEKEGEAIWTESRHALFPQRPVQTCHGMIGPFGEHPSRICGDVSFTIAFEKSPEDKVDALVRDCINTAVAGYTGKYGDKTKVTDPQTGKPKVDHHFDIGRDGNRFVVRVHGSTGHMGSIRENDGAITKMAWMVRQLVYSRQRLEVLGGPFLLELAGRPTGETLKLEGGQGFVPTHDIREVMLRMKAAAARGAEAYLRRLGRPENGADAVVVTYEKLHNVAFDGDPDSPAMRDAIAAARACGFWREQPVMGWTVSCDSRLFATEYPGMPVLTFGAGKLAHAHADNEQINLGELRSAVEFLALFLLRHTGTAQIPENSNTLPNTQTSS